MTLKITNPTWKTLVLLLIWLDPDQTLKSEHLPNCCQDCTAVWLKQKQSIQKYSITFYCTCFWLESFLLAESFCHPSFFQTAKKIGWCEVMLYEMLVGSRPFKGTNNIFVLYCNLSAHVSESLQSIRIVWILPWLSFSSTISKSQNQNHSRSPSFPSSPVRTLKTADNIWFFSPNIHHPVEQQNKSFYILFWLHKELYYLFGCIPSNPLSGNPQASSNNMLFTATKNRKKTPAPPEM